MAAAGRPFYLCSWKCFLVLQRVPHVQRPLLDNHHTGGKCSAADVVAKAKAELSEPELLRAMFDVGYFPTPPAG
jgi:hypothetical protein